MIRKYYLIEENHLNKKTTILKQCSKYNGLHEIETIAENYVKLQNGNLSIHYYLPNEHNRPFSYYIEKSRLDGITIKKKFKNYGYIFNDVFHQNILSYYIAEYYDYFDDDITYDLYRYSLFDSAKIYNDVMIDLKENYQNIINKLTKLNGDEKNIKE